MVGLKKNYTVINRCTRSKLYGRPRCDTNRLTVYPQEVSTSNRVSPRVSA